MATGPCPACVHLRSPGAGLIFEALQGHGLLLPISRKGQLRPSRNGLSAASTSAPQNIFPSRRGSLLTAGSAAVPVVAVPVVGVPAMPLTVSGRAQGVWDGFAGGLGWVGSAGNKSGGGRERPDGAPGHGSKSKTPHGMGCPRWVSQRGGHCPPSPGSTSRCPRHGGNGGGLGASAQPLLVHRHVPSLL